ncbi:MAG: polysaccharide biosynthesis protein [Clostridia bacterium]|nr:polysaccharide biosynthesis protein [Clostridia bacterium]
MKKNSFVFGMALLAIFNILGKVFGAIYRIPLAKFLGPEGMGVYQLIFTIFALILTLTTTGIPVAVSKLTAEFDVSKKASSKTLLLTANIFVLSISLIACLAVFLFADKFATFQGYPDAYFCYYAILPAILLSGLISVFRGYFQGKLKMFPTAFSILVEQVVKLVMGLFLIKKLAYRGINYATFGALLGISASELVAFIVIFTIFLFSHKEKEKLKSKFEMGFKSIFKLLLKTSFPVTVSGIILPLSSVIQSFLVVKILSKQMDISVATGLLGIESGVVAPLLNFPVAIAIALSTSLMPTLTSLIAKRETDKVEKTILKAHKIVLSVSLVSAVCFAVFAGQIVDILFSKTLNVENFLIAVKLVSLSSINIVFLSLIQVETGILHAIGNMKFPAISLAIGTVVKLTLSAILLSLPSINIMGIIIAEIIAFLLIFILDYYMVKKYTKFRIFSVYKSVVIQAALIALISFISNKMFIEIFSEKIAFMLAGGIVVLIYIISYYLMFIREKRTSVLVMKELKN